MIIHVDSSTSMKGSLALTVTSTIKFMLLLVSVDAKAFRASWQLFTTRSIRHSSLQASRTASTLTFTR